MGDKLHNFLIVGHHHHARLFASKSKISYHFRTVLNPKSIAMGELYGEEDKLTLEWKDGLMAISVRQAVQVCKCTVHPAFYEA